MNPLKLKQYETLKRLGCKDLADKVNEITRFLSDENEDMKCKNCVECKHEPEVCECCGDVICKKCGKRWYENEKVEFYPCCPSSPNFYPRWEINPGGTTITTC